ncbi:hypothetical protein B296_00054541 [Ensete ventricosum]|uniref:Uncharacterized protein n=1 Tax=Ensete ventricosum TaxID=4639 RepID=A0A426WX72_ENSVE|nr:hypothetical protein B296_00054541 [Ensete ventricosum]
MARPSTRVAGHGQAPCRGGQPRPGHLQGGGWLRPGLARKGGQRYPQRAAARKGSARGGCASGQKHRPQGLPPAASRGSIARYRQQGQHRPQRLPSAASRGSARPRSSRQRGDAREGAACRSKADCRGGSGDAEGAKGLGHFFEKRTILPL